MREYLVWLVAEARPEWFCLEEDDYRPQLPDAQGVLHSRIFPGLQLPVAPLLAGDTAKVLAALKGHEPLNRRLLKPMPAVRTLACLTSAVINAARADHEAGRPRYFVTGPARRAGVLTG